MGRGCILEENSYNPNFYLRLEWHSWTPVIEYKGDLFDYHSHANSEVVQVLRCHISKSCKLQFKTKTMSYELQPSYQKQLFFYQNHKSNCYSAESASDLWQVVPSKSFQVELNVGSKIKFGKVIAIVTSLKLPENKPPQTVLSSKSNCRICLQNQFTISDPLLEPCQCKGSMAKIHLSCLKKYTLKSDNKKVKNCSICGALFQLNYMLNGVKHSVVQQEQSLLEKAHLRFNLIDKHGQKSYIMQFQEKQEKTIGRLPTNDLRIDQGCVSRNHAAITLKQNVYYLRDMGSRFGTLIGVGNKLRLVPGKNYLFQEGNNLVEVMLNSSKIDYISLQDKKLITQINRSTEPPMLPSAPQGMHMNIQHEEQILERVQQIYQVNIQHENIQHEEQVIQREQQLFQVEINSVNLNFGQEEQEVQDQGRVQDELEPPPDLDQSIFNFQDS